MAAADPGGRASDGAGNLRRSGKGAPDSDLAPGIADRRGDQRGGSMVLANGAPPCRTSPAYACSAFPPPTTAGRSRPRAGVMVTEDGEVALLRAGRRGASRLGGRPVVARASWPSMPTAKAGRWCRRGRAGRRPQRVRVDRITRGAPPPTTAGTSSSRYRAVVDRRPRHPSRGRGRDAVSVATSPAAPPTYGPVRADRTPIGWRIDR
ncbi:hypothetical protein ACRAWD_11535 [Caulobacter segnis]